LQRLESRLDTAQDGIGLTLMDEQLPLRVRNRKAAKDGSTGAL
jgi:hypothetical protein